MVNKPLVPGFGKIFITSILLLIIGASGLGYIFFFLEPRLGPRWLFFFFLTILSAGTALPVVYLIQRRVAKTYVPAGVMIREALLFAVLVDIITWLQIGRILSDIIVFFLAAGILLIEYFLRLSEKAIFKPDEYIDE